MSVQNHENNVECFKRFAYPEAYQIENIRGGSPLVDEIFGKGREHLTFQVVEEGGEFYLTRAVSHFSENWRGRVHELPIKVAKFGKLLDKRVFHESQWLFLQESVFGRDSFEFIETLPGPHLLDCSLTFRMPVQGGLSFWARKGYLRFYLVIRN